MKLSPKQALQRIATFCAKKERCISEVEKKLKSWELSSEQVNAILKQLLQEKYIDETRFAKAFVHDKAKLAKWGRRKIEFELYKKQIPSHIINLVIDYAENINQENKILIQLLQKKMSCIKNHKNTYDLQAKLIRYAASKGYTLESITFALKHLKYNESLNTDHLEFFR